MEDQSGWCTIESDPGVFTELVEMIGVSGVEFEEVLTLDEASLSQLGDVLGLIFLFKWKGDNGNIQACSPLPEGMFFAKQVIENACATQAILNVLMNVDVDSVDVGTSLNDLRNFTEGLDDESKGFAIGNSDVIRASHNSFRPPLSLEVLHEDEKKKGGAFHFVSFLWFHGRVYELDGLKAGPVMIGECSERLHWLSVVIPYIQGRINNYTTADEREIRFNLMAITKDRRGELEKQLLCIEDKTSRAAEDIRLRLGELEYKRACWHKENARRRHDFVPLGLACLEVLASNGKLLPALMASRNKNQV
jgi:ubiquitin carboxyl-terminal hydrolase L5